MNVNESWLPANPNTDWNGVFAAGGKTNALRIPREAACRSGMRGVLDSVFARARENSAQDDKVGGVMAKR